MLKLSTNYVTMTTSILLIVIVTLTLTITITTSSTIGKKKYFSGYKFSTFKGTRFLPNSFNSNNKPQNDRVAVGTMDLPTVGCGTISWFANNLQQKQQLQELLTISTEIKLNFFDTAERYGASRVEAFGGDWGGCESLLGETIANSFGNTDGVDTTNSSDKVKSAGAIESGISTSPTKKSNKFNSCNSGNSPNKNENKLIVGTKFTPTPWRLDANSVVKACADSRKRLGVDSIDLYQIHMPDIVQPLRIFGIENVKDELYWDGMIECYRRGWIKNVGVCNYGPTLLLRAAEKFSRHNIPIATNQINYSLLYRKNGAQDTVDFGKSMGITTLAYYPLAMGLLSGKYSSINSITNKLVDKTSTKTKFEVNDLNKYQKIDKLLLVMEEIAQKRNKTIPQIALNWIICKGAIPIPGARNKGQLVDNAGARGWRLSSDEVKLLEMIADETGLTFEGAGFKRSSEKFVGYGVEKWQLN